MCDLSKVTCGQENSLGMKLAEPSVIIMNFADEVRPACGGVLVRIIWIRGSLGAGMIVRTSSEFD